ncbi:hypothetical protein PAXRUDRAFT_172127, partial [Paxillus rubicundulus Ve08.2h10]
QCLACSSQPIFCMQCCWQQHYMLPFQQIKQWMETFFEDFSLCLVCIVSKNIFPFPHLESH